MAVNLQAQLVFLDKDIPAAQAQVQVLIEVRAAVAAQVAQVVQLIPEIQAVQEVQV
jgi:hypothetical protein